MGLPIFGVPQPQMFGGVLEGQSLLPQPRGIGVGGVVAGPVSGILNPDAARAARQQAIMEAANRLNPTGSGLLAAGLSLLQTAGPSVMPRSLAQNLGAAGAAFVGAQGAAAQRQMELQERAAELEAENAARARLMENLSDRQRAVVGAAFDVSPAAGVSLAVQYNEQAAEDEREAGITEAVSEYLAGDDAAPELKRVIGLLEPEQQVQWMQRDIAADSEAERNAQRRAELLNGLANFNISPETVQGLTNEQLAEELADRLEPADVQLFQQDGQIVAADTGTGDIVNVQRIPGTGGGGVRPEDITGLRREVAGRADKFRDRVNLLGQAQAAYRRAMDPTASLEDRLLSEQQLVTLFVRSTGEGVVTAGEAESIARRGNTGLGGLLDRRISALFEESAELGTNARQQILQGIEDAIRVEEETYRQSLAPQISFAEAQGFTDDELIQAGLAPRDLGYLTAPTPGLPGGQTRTDEVGGASLGEMQREALAMPPTWQQAREAQIQQILGDTWEMLRRRREF